MYENEYMYAIERNNEYLAHYGVQGMKWGVRRALAKGDNQKLGRQYAKAQKKLAKLEKQAANSGKYARRAARLGVGAGIAGGLAAAGTGGVAKLMRGTGRVVNGAMRGVGKAMDTAGRAMVERRGTVGKIGSVVGTAGRSMKRAAKNSSKGITGASMAVQDWGRSTSISDKIRSGITRPGGTMTPGASAIAKAHHRLNGVSNNTIARVGAGIVGAGLAAGAARNAYKAATAKKRAEKFRGEMNKAFAGTKYGRQSSGGNRPRQGNGKRRNSGRR